MQQHNLFFTFNLCLNTPPRRNKNALCFGSQQNTQNLVTAVSVLWRNKASHSRTASEPVSCVLLVRGCRRCCSKSRHKLFDKACYQFFFQLLTSLPTGSYSTFTKSSNCVKFIKSVLFSLGKHAHQRKLCFSLNKQEMFSSWFWILFSFKHQPLYAQDSVIDFDLDE